MRKLARLLFVAIGVMLLFGVWRASLTTAQDVEPQCVTPGPPTSSITVHKFHDLDRDGTQGINEPDIRGWLIRVYQETRAGDWELVRGGRTGPDGTIVFGGLGPGPFKVWEEARAGWEPTAPSGVVLWNGGYYVMVGPDGQLGMQCGCQDYTVVFGNVYVCGGPNPDIEIDKAPDTQTVEPGGTVTFTITILNTGSVDLGPVVVEDLFALGCDQTIDSLPVGAMYSYECVVTDILESFTNVVLVTGTVSADEVVTDTDEANVQVVTGPEIQVRKLVGVGDGEWDDADLAPGPYVPAGDDVWFRFVVTNTGNVTLMAVTLEDDTDLDLSGCMVPAELAPDQGFECIVGPLEAVAGQHEDTATATGYYDGEPYDDSDPAHYFGADPGIDVEKAVNVGDEPWHDADDPPGPYTFVGQQVRFRYTIANIGNVPLGNITLEDDSGVDLSACSLPTDMAPGESLQCFVDDTAIAGQYASIATATGTYGGVTYDDEDRAHYFGAAPEIEVRGLIGTTGVSDWFPADTPEEALVVPAGSDIFFWYQIENTGNVPLTNLTLEDLALGGPGCTLPALLQPGEIYDDCTVGPLEAAEGLNWGQALGTGYYGGRTVDDEDETYYFGTPPGSPSIDLEKAVAIGGEPWYDANTPDEAPDVCVDGFDQVEFRFLVTNIGSEPLTDIALVDSVFGDSICANAIPTSLAADETFQCILGPYDPDLGWHSNVATATASAGGAMVQAIDAVYYYGLLCTTGQLLVEPDTQGVVTGETVAFRATLRSPDGTLEDVTQGTVFSTSAAAGGAWSANVYSGGRPGTWRVKAQYGDLGAETMIRVEPCRVFVPVLMRGFTADSSGSSP